MTLRNLFPVIITVSLPINSYGASIEEINYYSGASVGQEWSAYEERYIDGAGIHDVNVFTTTLGNSTPYDAYARNELDVTGAGGCTAEEISSITGCNRSGAGSYIPDVGFALYDDKYQASYESAAQYIYTFTASQSLIGAPSSPDGYIPITFSYEITASVTADSLSVAPSYNGGANLWASSSVEMFGIGSLTPIVSKTVDAILNIENVGGNIFDNDWETDSLDISILEGNSYSIILDSYIDVSLWVLENGDRMNITADAYADPIIAIDPNWEYAEFYDLTFEMADTYFTHETSISSVPVPAAAWLFGSGLLGLIGVARRKKAA